MPKPLSTVLAQIAQGTIPPAILVGGALIIAGGLTITFWRA